jgi:hypothetical protein
MAVLGSTLVIWACIGNGIANINAVQIAARRVSGRRFMMVISLKLHLAGRVSRFHRERVCGHDNEPAMT